MSGNLAEVGALVFSGTHEGTTLAEFYPKQPCYTMFIGKMMMNQLDIWGNPILRQTYLGSGIPLGGYRFLEH